jgi:hypothetical protein
MEEACSQGGALSFAWWTTADFGQGLESARPSLDSAEPSVVIILCLGRRCRPRNARCPAAISPIRYENLWRRKLMQTSSSSLCLGALLVDKMLVSPHSTSASWPAPRTYASTSVITDVQFGLVFSARPAPTRSMLEPWSNCGRICQREGASKISLPELSVSPKLSYGVQDTPWRSMAFHR